MEDDIISTDGYLTLRSPNIEYVKTDWIQQGRNSFKWRGSIWTVKANKVWITGHSDAPVNAKLYNRYKSKSQQWFTVNKDHVASNLFALPLGVTNDTAESCLHVIYGNRSILRDVMRSERLVTGTVYVNFKVSTFPAERSGCMKYFKDQPWVTLGSPVDTLEGRSEFLKQCKSHEFVVCPRGNGIDTHRLWETLYVGSTPIVKRHVALAEFEDLPIWFVNDWHDVTEASVNEQTAMLAAKPRNLEKLSLKYWKDRISSAAI